MSSSPSRWTVDRTVAIVLAGGSGTRVGLDIPKQLLKIAGRTILEHTIQVLNRAIEIDEIVIMMNPGYIDVVKTMMADGGYHKVTAVLPGGGTRNDTTRLALDTLGDADCSVLLHDAVRPLVSERIIRECVNALRDFEAVDVAIPSADTIIQVRDDSSSTCRTGPSCDGGRRRRPSGCPPSVAPTTWQSRILTSRRPTTARSSCATSRTCRSRSSRAPTRT